MRLLYLRSAIAALLLLAPVLQAQAQEEGCRVPDPSQTVLLEFHKTELHNVIDMMATMTCQNFLYDEHVQGRVTLLGKRPLPIPEAYELLLATLEHMGFATVDAPGHTVRIVPMDTALRLAPMAETAAEMSETKSQETAGEGSE